jgi:hypothetical protein
VSSDGLHQLARRQTLECDRLTRRQGAACRPWLRAQPAARHKHGTHSAFTPHTLRPHSHTHTLPSTHTHADAIGASRHRPTPRRLQHCTHRQGALPASWCPGDENVRLGHRALGYAIECLGESRQLRPRSQLPIHILHMEKRHQSVFGVQYADSGTLHGTVRFT